LKQEDCASPYSLNARELVGWLAHGWIGSDAPASIVLDEIIEKEIPKVQENQNVQKQEKKVPQTPTSVIIYTKLSRPPEGYSHSFYYLLLTNYGELEIYEEAMQVETKR
jgi:hypothetical protein